MVRFLNLETVEIGSLHLGDHSINHELPSERPLDPKDIRGIQFQTPPVEQPHSVQRLAALLAAYPIACQFASNIDITTLFTTSSLCKEIYGAILPNRLHLKRRTARCYNEAKDWFSYKGAEDLYERVLRCARDMVKECQRCDLQVCRDCVSKPPHEPRYRFRQLCRKCQVAPLEAFSRPSLAPASCVCTRSFWLCLPCGRKACVADTLHRQQLEWRRRYSAHNQSTLGVGFGQGIEGIRCGAGVDHCLGAYEVEVERAQPVSQQQQVNGNGSISGSNSVSDTSNVGYDRTEMEGIGGMLVEKVREKKTMAAYVEENLLPAGGQDTRAGDEARGAGGAGVQGLRGAGVRGAIVSFFRRSRCGTEAMAQPAKSFSDGQTILPPPMVQTDG